MNNSRGGGNLIGKATALAVLVGAVYGVHRLSCGGGSCPVMSSSCGMHEQPEKPASAPAKFDADNGAAPDAPGR